MVDQSALSALLEVQDLPTLPIIVNKILAVTADEESSAADLTELLERDHAISARVLRLANSAFYGLPHRVDSVRQGVLVLGFNQTRYLALATSVFDTMSKGKQLAFDPEDFWMHSFGVAKAAQLVSKRYCPKIKGEGCFTSGLLHDIGKYALACILKAEYKAIVDQAKVMKRPLADVEVERLGMNHAQVGRWLVDKWRFPEFIGHIIANFSHAVAYSGADREIVAAIAIANLLTLKAEFGFAGEPEDPPISVDLLIILDMNRKKFDDTVVELASLREETRQFLQVLGERSSDESGRKKG